MHPFSCKGQPDLVREEHREPRKRGSDRKTRGISNEQVCVLTATDSSDALLFRVVKRGRLDTETAKKELGQRIRRKPVKRDILVTDSQKAYNGIAKEKNLIHKAIPTGEYATIDGFNIQKINSLHYRLDKWMARFNGVSSKYLQNYMNYFVILEKSKNIRERFLEIWKWILVNKNAFIPYRHIYQQFQRT